MVWPYKLAASERLLLQRQATFDKRNLRPVWFWVFDVDSSPLDEVHLQTSKHLRKYIGPMPAYFYIETAGGEPQIVETGVDRHEERPITVSIAETYRLAQVLASRKDFHWDLETNPQYFPRAQDVFQFGSDLWELQDRAVPENDWGTTSIATVCKTTAAKMRLDSVAPTSPLVVQAQPPSMFFPPELNAEKGQK